MLDFRRTFSRFSRSLLLLLPLLFAACVGDVDPFFSFNLKRQFSGTVPVSPSGIDTTFRFNIVDSAEFQERQTSHELIESAIVTKLGLTSAQALNTIDSVEYFVSADTIPRIHLATLRNLPALNDFATAPAEIDLASYFRRPSFNLEIHVVSSQAISSEMLFDFEQIFYLVAQPR